MNTKEYRQLLVQIRDLLLSVEDSRWGPRLQSWISELDAVTGDEIATVEHIRRTRRSIAGMGSMSDIVICEEAGHHVTDANAQAERLNAQLQESVHSLFIGTAGLLGEKP